MRGTEALFERVDEIARKLAESGAKDSGGPYEEHTRAYIADQAREQIRKREGEAPDHADAKVTLTSYGDQISYLHNEFNFDTARPLENFALVSHVSFTPIFPPRNIHRRADEREARAHFPIRYDLVEKSMLDRLQKLRKEAVHEVDRTYVDEDFRGGRDGVTKRTSRFLSYDQRVVTTLRSIERMRHEVHEYLAAPARTEKTRQAAAKAEQWNAQLASHVQSSGLSSRLSMLREYMLLLSDDPVQKSRFHWVRHHSHYQTLTAIEEAHLDPAEVGGLCDKDPAQDFAAAPTLGAVLTALCSAKGEETKRLLQYTAFDLLPDSWAKHLFGRYLQGANYLVFPLEFLFRDDYILECERYVPTDRRLDTEWRETWREVCTACGQGAPADSGAAVSITADNFRSLWAAAQGNALKLRAVTRLAMRLLGPLTSKAFVDVNRASDLEFVMCGVAEGGGILLSDVRNFSNATSRASMSATLVLDLGMNDFERGRLLKGLAEFSTQRFLALTALGTFRFFSDALDIIQADLSRATQDWLSNVSRHGDVSGTKAKSEEPAEAHEEKKKEETKDRTYINALQDILINLTMLNDLVDGGISAHSASVEASKGRLTDNIAGIGELPLPGFMGLTGFLERRFSKSVRAVTSVGYRYGVLRQRISELSTLVEAKVQISQNEQQTDLLNKVDRLTLFGIIYYFGTIIAYIFAGAIFLREGRRIDNISELGDLAKFVVFLPLFFFGFYIGREVLVTLVEESKPKNTGWFDRRGILPWLTLVAVAALTAAVVFVAPSLMSRAPPPPAAPPPAAAKPPPAPPPTRPGVGPSRGGQSRRLGRDSPVQAAQR